MTNQVEKLIPTLARLRAIKAALTAEYDEKVRSVNKAIEEIEVGIRADMNTRGLKSVRTGAGLITLTSERKYHVADWSELYDHILKTGNFGLLQKRLGEGATKEFVEENSNVPPGVSFADLIKVNFTKPKEKA